MFTTSSDTFGFEIDGRVMFNAYLQMTANFIFQDHEITDGEFEGNALVRLPKVHGQPRPPRPVRGLRRRRCSGTSTEARSRIPGNGVELDSFSIVRAELGYTIPVADADTLRVSVNIWNLFDSQGLQEGNPRAGLTQSEDEDAQFFVGRPILPRRITVRLTYDFF